MVDMVREAIEWRRESYDDEDESEDEVSVDMKKSEHKTDSELEISEQEV